MSENRIENRVEKSPLKKFRRTPMNRKQQVSLNQPQKKEPETYREYLESLFRDSKADNEPKDGYLEIKRNKVA